MEPYPKPQAVGGQLIRQVIQSSREQGLELPLASHILIAVSGGLDSMALAHLLIRYGRRWGERQKMEILHIDHGWRGEESDQDRLFVEAYASQMSIPCRTIRLNEDWSRFEGDSLEAVARQKRKEVFEAECARVEGPAWVVTAHHADDLAETLLWRLFTGALESHGKGIHFCHGNEIRPLLGVRKETLKKFLEEEGVSWREDQTNQDERFLRNSIRKRLMPQVEALFPRAIQHLSDWANEWEPSPETLWQSVPKELKALVEEKGLRIRRSQLKLIERMVREKKDIEVSLPQGWVLRRRDSSHSKWQLTQEKS